MVTLPAILSSSQQRLPLLPPRFQLSLGALWRARETLPEERQRDEDGDLEADDDDGAVLEAHDVVGEPAGGGSDVVADALVHEPDGGDHAAGRLRVGRAALLHARVHHEGQGRDEVGGDAKTVGGRERESENRK